MTAHVRVCELLVGDVLVGGTEVTMLGLSSRHPGPRFIAGKREGRYWGATLSQDDLVAIDTRYRR